MKVQEDDSPQGPGRRYTRDLFIKALKELDGMGSVAEISDEVGCSNETTRRRMKQLKEEGRVTSRKVGRSSLWMLDEKSG
jgi:predicted ArsR family transcriptional regulator